MNLFFHFFIANVFISLLLVLLFARFSSSLFLGGFVGMLIVATLTAFLFSSLIPSWFSLSNYGPLYWIIYYSVPTIGASLGLLLLQTFSRPRNDI